MNDKSVPLSAISSASSITCEGRHVGIWGWVDGALGFRTLANWEPRIVAVDADAALAATMKMAEARNWTR